MAVTLSLWCILITYYVLVKNFMVNCTNMKYRMVGIKVFDGTNNYVKVWYYKVMVC